MIGLIVFISSIAFAVWFLIFKKKIGKKRTREVTAGGRKLGLLERYYTAYHVIEQTKVIAYSARLQGKVPQKGQILSAIKEISTVHQGLKASLVPAAGNKEETEFRWLDDVDYESVFHFHTRQSEEDYKQITQQELNSSFDLHSNKPLWRVILIAQNDREIQDFEIVVVVHHLICDGISGQILTVEFLEILNHFVSGGKSKPQLDYDTSFPMEEVLDIRPNVFHIVSVLFTTYILSKYKKPRLGFMPVKQDSPLGKSTDHIVFHSVQPDKLQQIVAVSKRERISVHAFLSVCFTAALAKFEMNYSNNQKMTEWSQQLETPISLRKFCKGLPRNALGVFISKGEHCRKHSADSNIWELARRIKTEIEITIPKVVPQIGLLGYCPNIPGLFKLQMARRPGGRNSLGCISNLGVYELRDTLWHVKEIYFSQPAHCGSGSSFMFSVTTVNNALAITLASPQPTMPVEWNQEVLDYFASAIDHLLDASKNDLSSLRLGALINLL